MKRLLPFSLMLALTACVAPAPAPESSRPDSVQPPATQNGVSVAAHPAAAAAGAEILDKGGNAADAAVAAGFAIAVTESTMNSIGGRSQIIVRTPSGEFQIFDGMTEIPAGYTEPAEPVADGYGVIATPGVVASLASLHEAYGRLPWQDLLQPAIRLAEQGFVMLPGEAARQASALEKIQDNPGFQQNFLPGGQSPVAGEVFRQPVLATTLKRIAAEGATDFYRGETAAAIARDMAANGGFVTLEDLAAYKTLPGRYVTTDYRGYQIHSMAAPGGGGLVVKTLNILENLPLADFSDAAWALAVNQALALAINTMNDDYPETDLERVMSKEWARKAAAGIHIPALANRAAQKDVTGSA
ncbi:MAG: gamma-glutamyltransferase, partial [Pseudomonadales bacterium]|nr:gamma-glutamyltransferase [Pseudomonadales bacterium]